MLAISFVCPKVQAFVVKQYLKCQRYIAFCAFRKKIIIKLRGSWRLCCVHKWRLYYIITSWGNCLEKVLLASSHAILNELYGNQIIKFICKFCFHKEHVNAGSELGNRCVSLVECSELFSHFHSQSKYRLSYNLLLRLLQLINNTSFYFFCTTIHWTIE